MIMKTIKKICALAVCALASLPSMAQQTYLEMEQLTINENVTTVIILPDETIERYGYGQGQDRVGNI